MLSSSINLLFSSENIKKSLCFRLLFISSLLRWFGKRHPMCCPNVRINLGQQFPAINHAMILRNAHPPPRQIPNKHWIATTRQSILDADPLRYVNGGKRHDGLYVFCAAPVLHQSHNRRSRSMHSSTAAPPVPPSLDLKSCLPHGILRPRRRWIQRVHLRAAVRVPAADRGDVGPHRMPLRRGYGAPRLRAAERASLHPCRPPLWRIAASGRRIHRQMSAAKEA